MKKENILEQLKENEESKNIKLFTLIEKLAPNQKEWEEVVNLKNKTREYVIRKNKNIDIIFKPYRKEVIIKVKNDKGKNDNIIEVYHRKGAYSLFTRGCYLLKTTFNKKDKEEKAILNLLKENKNYKSNFDMKHFFNNLPLDIALKTIKKLLSLDNNLNLTTNDLVEEGEILDSTKYVEIENKEEEA